MSNIKKINIKFEPEMDKEKKPKKRVVTNSISWIDFENKYEKTNQLKYVFDILNNNHGKETEVITKEINKKISGYKSQDKLKKLFDPDKFVNFTNIIEKMSACELKCYYCKLQTNILYETVRDNTQWSLERLENEFGHNNDNVVISCLKCNITRKTMYHERYLFTKEIKNIKKV